MSLYLQAAECIRRRISSGAYPLGSKIPNESELAQELGISRPTMRQAMSLLTKEGILRRVRGKGTFVTQPKVVHESTSFVTGYREESRKHNRVLRTRVLCNQWVKADETVAEALKVKTGELVGKLVRVRHLEGVDDNAPVVYTTVFVPRPLFSDLVELDFTDASLYEAMDERGISVAHASRRLEVMMPPPEVYVGLEITPFEPAVFITSQGFTDAGVPVEYSESYYPASRSSFRIEIKR